MGHTTSIQTGTVTWQTGAARGLRDLRLFLRSVGLLLGGAFVGGLRLFLLRVVLLMRLVLLISVSCARFFLILLGRSLVSRASRASRASCARITRIGRLRSRGRSFLVTVRRIAPVRSRGRSLVGCALGCALLRRSRCRSILTSESTECEFQ